MSGVEATQRIRANPKYKDLIIIALTGNFSEQSKEQARTAGMDDFIAKPFNKKVLQQKLTKLVNEKGQQQIAAYTEPVPQTLISPTSAAAAYSLDGTSSEVNALTDSLANRYTPEYESQEAFFNNMPLIDYAQLTGFQSNFSNRFQEFLNRFLSNLIARNGDLQSSFANKDMHAILMALHSLVGVTGYVGAHALHQYIKLRVYPAVHAGYLPDEEAWVETVGALVKETVEVLRKRYP